MKKKILFSIFLMSMNISFNRITYMILQKDIKAEEYEQLWAIA